MATANESSQINLIYGIEDNVSKPIEQIGETIEILTGKVEESWKSMGSFGITFDDAAEAAEKANKKFSKQVDWLKKLHVVTVTAAKSLVGLSEKGKEAGDKLHRMGETALSSFEDITGSLTGLLKTAGIFGVAFIPFVAAAGYAYKLRKEMRELSKEALSPQGLATSLDNVERSLSAITKDRQASLTIIQVANAAAVAGGKLSGLRREAALMTRHMDVSASEAVNLGVALTHLGNISPRGIDNIAGTIQRVGNKTAATHGELVATAKSAAEFFIRTPVLSGRGTQKMIRDLVSLEGAMKDVGRTTQGLAETYQEFLDITTEDESIQSLQVLLKSVPGAFDKAMQGPMQFSQEVGKLVTKQLEDITGQSYKTSKDALAAFNQFGTGLSGVFGISTDKAKDYIASTFAEVKDGANDSIKGIKSAPGEDLMEEIANKGKEVFSNLGDWVLGGVEKATHAIENMIEYLKEAFHGGIGEGFAKVLGDAWSKSVELSGDAFDKIGEAIGRGIQNHFAGTGLGKFLGVDKSTADPVAAKASVGRKTSSMFTPANPESTPAPIPASPTPGRHVAAKATDTTRMEALLAKIAKNTESDPLVSTRSNASHASDVLVGR